MHLLEGFKIALLNLDDVIQLIKTSPTPKDAREGLQARYSLSEIQAQAILELRLQKLTGMERLAIEQEHAELAKEIERLLGILSDSRCIDEVICSELRAVKETFTDDRRTEIVDDGGEIAVEDLIEDEEMVVSVSHKGYIKRTAVSEYRAQKRGGKGIAGASGSDDGDFIEHLFVASTLADLLVFTTLGRLYWMKVYETPEAGRTAKGRALVNLLQLKPEETITAILPVREFTADKHIVMCTRDGVIKKIELMEFQRSRRSGVVACTLKENDLLVSVSLVSSSEDVLVATKEGMAIRFDENDVRAMGRAAAGVRAIKLEEKDAVVGMAIVPTGIEIADDTAPVESSEETTTLLTVCENGYGKRTPIGHYRKQQRGGKGLIDIQTDERNGPAIGVCVVNAASQLMLITSAGQIIRFKAGDVSVVGRNTKGVKLINLAENEKVVAIAPLVEGETESGE
jgi:DNA gyrase subunit A